MDEEYVDLDWEAGKPAKLRSVKTKNENSWQKRDDVEGSGLNGIDGLADLEADDETVVTAETGSGYSEDDDDTGETEGSGSSYGKDHSLA